MLSAFFVAAHSHQVTASLLEIVKVSVEVDVVLVDDWMTVSMNAVGKPRMAGMLDCCLPACTGAPMVMELRQAGDSLATRCQLCLLMGSQGHRTCVLECCGRVVEVKVAWVDMEWKSVNVHVDVVLIVVVWSCRGC